MDLSVSYWQYNSGLVLSSLWGDTTDLLLTNFSYGGTGHTLTTDDGILYTGEQFVLDGRNVEFIGSGWARPGLELLPLGPAVDLVLMEDTDTGERLFVFPDGEPNFFSLTAMHVLIEPQAYSATFAGADPICFCRGTRIATPAGPKPVEALHPGDVVHTTDGGTATILWAGHRDFTDLPLGQRPITISPRSRFAPDRPLRLSPQHRVVIGNDANGGALLVAAKALLGEIGVRRDRSAGTISYHHILLDRHAVVLAEGVKAETLLLACGSLRSIGPRGKLAIMTALRCTRDALLHQPQARPAGRLLTVREGRAFLDRQRRSRCQARRISVAA